MDVTVETTNLIISSLIEREGERQKRGRKKEEMKKKKGWRIDRKANK